MGKEKNPQKALAFQYFLAGKSNKDIAARVGVTEHTVGRWAAAENWASLELANATRTQALVIRFENAIENQLQLIEKEQGAGSSIAKSTDALVKLVNSKDKIQSSLSLSAYVQVMEDFLNSIDNPKLKREIAEAQRKFLTERGNGL